MATITFDTLKFVRKLETAGFSPQQAEAVADALKDVEIGQELATRRDVELVRQEARETELRTDTKFEEIKGELKTVKWMLAVIVGGVIALVMKAFFSG